MFALVEILISNCKHFKESELIKGEFLNSFG